jgi:putative salt-induced outer membrane protein
MYRFVLIAAFCATAVFADQIALKNGDRVSGKIVNTDDKTVTVKSDLMGEVKVEKAAIVSIRSDEPINVTLKDGKTVVGKVETAGSEVSVVQDGKPIASAPIDSVVAFRDGAAQHAWEREQERVMRARWDDFWSGTVGFSFANTSGNSQTTNLATTALMQRIAGKNKTAVYFAQVYGTQSTTIPRGTIANRIGGGVRQDRDISPKFFLFGNADFAYDQFLDLDLRAVLGGGLGYHVWKAEKGYFDIGAGGAWDHEKFNALIDPVRNSMDFISYEEWSYQPYKKLKLFERFAVYPNLTDPGQYRFNATVTASVPIYKWFEWTVGINNSYLSNPPIGRKTNDFLATTGIAVSFDQTKR